MNRNLQLQLQSRRTGLSARERVLVHQLDSPTQVRMQGSWVKKFARGFLGFYFLQTLLATTPAFAQQTSVSVPRASLVAAPNAPSGQKPLVDAAANGVPIVMIAPPSTSGVSRNQFSEFNVDFRGLILNNSTGNTSTSLGGWITGNLQLGQNTARIILNEVTGTSASQIKGTIEIAGQRADLVIANPNGIACDGCGFLNSSQVTLTTGTPQMGAAGNLTGFDVRQGVITVGSGGLNATEQQQLDLVARGLVLEGEVYSQSIRALIGANQVVYGTLTATQQAGEGSAPRFAIDIKDLGGMYAGQIFLIATDKGLGVNSTGRTATTAANLVLSANGDLTLKDTGSKQAIELSSTGSVTLNGQTVSPTNIKIDAPKLLANNGVLQADTLELSTPRIENSGTLAQLSEARNLDLTLPGGLQNSGTIYTPAQLNIQASAITGRSDTTGQLLSGGSLSIKADTLDLAGQRLASNQDISVSAQSLRTKDGSMSAVGKLSLNSTGVLQIDGNQLSTNSTVALQGREVAMQGTTINAVGSVQVVSAEDLTARGSAIASNGEVALQGRNIDLQAGTVSSATNVSVAATQAVNLNGSVVGANKQVNLQGSSVSTSGATVYAERVTVEGGSGVLNNQGGKILAASSGSDALTLNAAGINNQGGEIRTNGGLTIDARNGQVDNTSGVIAGTTGTLSHLGGLSNNGGTLVTQSDLNLTGFALNNSGGTIITSGNLTVGTPGQAINNNAGVLQAGGNVQLDSGGANLQNSGGSVLAGASLTVSAGTVATDSGTMAAGRSLTVNASELQGSGAILGSGADATLAIGGNAALSGATIGAGGSLNVNAASISATGAAASSGGDVALTAGSLNGGAWSASGNLTANTTGTLDVSGGALLAGSKVDVQAQAITTNSAKVGGQVMNLNARNGALNNVGGSIVASGTTGNVLTVKANGIDNTGGTLAASADATLNANGRDLNNQNGGVIQVDGVLQLQANKLLNHGGSLSTGNSLTLQGVALDNFQGKIQTKGDLTINTAGQVLENTGGTLAANGNVNVTAGTLNSAGGKINAGGSNRIEATSLDISSGQMTGGQALEVLVTQRLNAGTTTIASGGQLTISAADIDVSQSKLQSVQQMSVTATGALDATNAAIASLKGVDLSAGTALALNASTVQANEDLRVAGTSVAAANTTLATAGKLIVNAGTGAATIDQSTLTAGDTLSISGAGISAQTAAIGAVNNIALQAATGDVRANDVKVVSQDGAISVSGANIQIAASLAPASGALPTKGLLAKQNIAISATGSLDNTNAVISSGADLTINTQGALTNTKGSISATGQASLVGTVLNNQGGTVDATGPLTVNVSAGQVVNDQGRISTRDVLTMTKQSGALTSLSNQGGTINTTGALNLQLQGFDNRGGSVVALAGLTVAGGAVDNDAGVLASKGNLSVNTQGGSFRNANGQVMSEQGNVTINAGAMTLDNSKVLAQGSVNLGGTQATAAGVNVLANTGSVQINLGNGSADFTQSTLNAAQSINVTAGSLTASRSTVKADTGIAITSSNGADLGNSSVTAQTVQIAAGAGAINNANGTIVASATTGTALTLQGQGLDNSNGTIASGANLNVNAGSGNLSNTSGAIYAVGSATIASTGLNNANGTIGANAALSVNAAQANSLTATNNVGGSIRSTSDSVALTTGALDNTNSEISAGTDLVVTANGALANASGRLIGLRDATVQATDVNNVAGLIGGNHNVSVTATAGGLANGTGTVRAGTDLAVHTTGAIDNVSGKLLAGGALDIVGGAMSNASGKISAANGNASLSVSSYTNLAGQLNAGGNLSLDTRGGLLEANGSTFTSQGNMSLSGGTTQFNDASLVSAGSLTMQGTGVELARSNLQAGTSMTINSGSGALAANDAQFRAVQNASLAGGAVQLRQSTVAANGTVQVRGNSVDATQANFSTPGDLSLTATGALYIGNATLMAGQDLVATGTGAGTTSGAVVLAGRDLTLGNGANFDFGHVDLQYQFGRDLAVHAQGINTAGLNVNARNLTLDAGNGQMNNAGGSLTATQSVSISGNGINNQNGVIAANGSVIASAGNGTLNNANGQIYSTQGSLSVAGGAVQNTGTLGAAGDINISGGTLYNSNNSIVAGSNLTVSMSGAVLNDGGRLIANNGTASVVGNGINNVGGVISGQSATADAGAGTLSNTGGQVTGQSVSIGGNVDNSAGVISGSNSVSMSTGWLGNDAGVIESGSGGIYINTNGQSLSNTASGSTRGIVSQGSISISAGSISNQGGYIGANGGLNINQSSSISNQGGTLLGLGTSSIATSGELSNQGGKVQSNGDLSITAGTLNNSGSGSVFANRNLSVTASSIDNSNTVDGGHTTGLLAGGNLTLNSGSVNNSNGAVVSMGALAITATGGVNNSQGQIIGKTVDIDAPSLTNTGGRVDATDRLTLKVPQFSADGTIASNGTLELKIQGDYTNTGTVSASNDLDISTTGSYTNQGRVSAQHSLKLTANGITNAASGTIDSQSTTLNASGGTLANAGLINSTSGQTTITAGAINNTGKIYGNSVGINGSVSNAGRAAIASRSGDVTINGSLSNTGESLVLSLGSISLNGDVTNSGSTINASANIGISGNLSNVNDGFTTGTNTRTVSASQTYIIPAGSTQRYSPSELTALSGDMRGGDARWLLPSQQYPAAVFGSNSLLSYVSCDYFSTDPCVYYPANDPIWAKFNIAPVTTPAPTLPAGEGTCMVQADLFSSDMVRSTSAACGAYWGQYDANTQQTQARQSQLETAVAAFNTDLASRVIKDWYEVIVTGSTITETSVISSKPGQILAGGNISLAGGTNSDSIIVAGGSITGVATQNIASKGTSLTTETGTIEFTNIETHCSPICRESRYWKGQNPLASAPVGGTTDLPIMKFKPNETPDAPGSVGTSSPVGGGSAMAPQVGASVGGVGSSSTGPSTGSTAGGNVSLTPAGGPVHVGSTTTDAAASLQGPQSIQNAAGSTVNTSTTGTTPGSIQVGLSGVVQAALPGSVIAGGVRANQLATINSSQTNFATLVNTRPAPVVQVSTSSSRGKPGAVKAEGFSTVRASGQISAPNNQLFRVGVAPDQRYLVETDPAFTDFGQWTSSSYMLAQLNLNPERTLKLYGDGFAEQRLVDDQILALTGRRFIGDYSSTQDEYESLLDSGAMFAKQYQLTPGVALSAEQMANLTSDIVWLEEKTITLADGTTAQALVPTVYLRRPVEGDLSPTGALISGSNVTLRSPGDLTNSGNIMAYGDTANGNGNLVLQANNVTNTGALAGGNVTVGASQTITLAGGTIQGLGGDSTVNLNARDIILRTTTQSNTASIEGPNGTSTGSRTNIDRIATMTGGSVTLAAGNNINLIGATVSANNNLNITVGGDFTISAVQTGYTLNVPMGGNVEGRSGHYQVAEIGQQISTLSAGKTDGTGLPINVPGNINIAAIGNANLQGTNAIATGDITIKAASINVESAKTKLAIDQQGVGSQQYIRVAQSDEALAGGNIQAGTNVNLIANGANSQGNITTTGANVGAGTGQANLVATGDIKVHNTTTEHSLTQESFVSSSTLISSSSSSSKTSSQTTQVEGSSIGGNSVTIQGNKDVLIAGSSVIGDQQTNVKATGNLSVVGASSTNTSTSFSQKTESGLLSGGGIGISIGERDQSLDSKSTSTQNVGSTVGAIDGNVALAAGGNYTQVGSDVVTPNGNIDITAKNISITEARESGSSQTEQKFSQSGVTLALSGGVISAVQNTIQEIQTAKRSSGGRRLGNLLMAMDDAMAAKSAASGIKNGYEKGGVEGAAKAGGISVNISLGQSQSQSKTETTTDTAAGSSVIASGAVSLNALGDGQDGNLLVKGSTIDAGTSATLHANGQIDLAAATNTSNQTGSDTSSSAAVGVSISLGSQSGIAFTANASQAQGSGDGTTTTYTNTHVNAGTVALSSGADTNIAGAVVNAGTITADIGGNLKIESLQDSGTSKSQSSSAGVGVSLCIPPLCVGSNSASLSMGNNETSGNYASVTEQSGIKAGNGGFQVTVAGDTKLVGGLLDSSADAAKNNLTTGSLTVSNLQNTSNASSQSQGLNVGTDMFSGYGAGKAVLGAVHMSNGESQSSSGTTRSAIAPGTGNITATDPDTKASSEAALSSISRDTAHANQSVARIDAQAMETRVRNEANERAADVALVSRVTDEAYEKMFKETPKFYKVVCQSEKQCTTQPATAEEVKQGLSGKDPGTAVLAVNGILNPLDRAAQLVYQNAELVKSPENPQGVKPDTMYLMHYVPAQSTVAEILIAGYEQKLAPVLGYTNQDVAFADAIQSVGNNNLTSLGHSRGTIVQTNANNILGDREFTNPNLSVRGVGGAVTAAEYTSAAAQVVGKDNVGNITFNYFRNDPVPVAAGGNPGILSSDGVSSLTELWNILTTPNSAHSCYGTGANGCKQVEILTPNAPAGATQDNSNLVRYKGGREVDANGNPIPPKKP